MHVARALPLQGRNLSVGLHPQMDDEQRGGNFVNKGLGSVPMEHPLPPRPPCIVTSYSAPRRPSTSKKDTSTSTEHEMLKVTSTAPPIATSPLQDASTVKSTEPLLQDAKDEYLGSHRIEALEQRPVMPFWDENDPIEQRPERSTASGDVVPHHGRPKKQADRDVKVPLLARIDTSGISLSQNLPPTPFPQGPSAQQNKWKPIGDSGGSSSDSHEVPKSPAMVTNGATPLLSLGSASTKVPTGPKHREATKHSGNKSTWTKTMPQNPIRAPIDAPTEPRSMRKVRTTPVNSSLRADNIAHIRTPQPAHRRRGGWRKFLILSTLNLHGPRGLKFRSL
jgi:hypothetical protein